MHKNIKKFLKKLDDVDVNNQDPIDKLYDAVDIVEGLDEVKEIIPNIFDFMRKHSKSDLGSPGPLVHLIEKFYPNIIDQLIDSQNKLPTYHTLWMVDRVLNDPNLNNENRIKLIDCLSDIASNPSVESSIKEEAMESLKTHKR